ncbi:unnamed protein product [Rotaria sp. Silwood2]|nr:unnamed protein product [Rotaria sp. Silwood2]CAF2974929.1 unnamed protein product [Rotaria sp. Silwood2]CAF4125920.1 unnamed protein product [Rotaria sp. Silwood2]CAF4156003.1 unnamed protein product [Rotaria sp. Silwood2]
MWNQIRSFIFWLHKPDHVAKFQHYFGILPISMCKSDPISIVDENDINKNPNNNSINDDNKKTHTPNGLYHRHHERKVTYDTNVLDECIQEIKHSTNQNQNKKNTSADIDYKVTSWFWYYFFQIGSALGNEIFYILFFPIWIWNVDGCVARKVSILWVYFMYIGQATKDILGMPRPSSPPVIQLEKRYVQEYGFPSTHAMFATGIPLSLVLLSHQRYDFNISIGLACAVTVCVWVCLSRIYLGMHTFLDIIGGTAYALFLIYIMFPYVNIIDNFQVNFTLAPLLNFCLGIFLMKCYPSVEEWSTARSDTTVILGSTFGLLSATTMMQKFGLLARPLTPPIYSITAPNLGFCVLRTITGLLIVYATRQIVKTIVLRVTSIIYGLDWRDPKIKRFAKVEMPYYYLTYFAIGFNIAFTCPLAFRAIGINRDYSYTEL